MQVQINITLELHMSSIIHRASYQEFNGTAVLQSMDFIETEKIRKSIN